MKLFIFLLFIPRTFSMCGKKLIYEDNLGMNRTFYIKKKKKDILNSFKNNVRKKIKYQCISGTQITSHVSYRPPIKEKIFKQFMSVCKNNSQSLKTTLNSKYIMK
nr:hypothetical protein 1634Bnrm1_p045 [Cryptomonas sp.]